MTENDFFIVILFYEVTDGIVVEFVTSTRVATHQENLEKSGEFHIGREKVREIRKVREVVVFP